MSTTDTTAAAPTAAIRDQVGDHPLTPKNSVMVVIDYQPGQLAGVRSRDPDLLLKNAVSAVKVAKLFGVPIVHSTINVRTGRGKPTLPPLAELLVDNPPIDRTTTNALVDATRAQIAELRRAKASGGWWAAFSRCEASDATGLLNSRRCPVFVRGAEPPRSSRSCW